MRLICHRANPIAPYHIDILVLLTHTSSRREAREKKIPLSLKKRGNAYLGMIAEDNFFGCHYLGTCIETNIFHEFKVLGFLEILGRFIFSFWQTYQESSEVFNV